MLIVCYISTAQPLVGTDSFAAARRLAYLEPNFSQQIRQGTPNTWTNHCHRCTNTFCSDCFAKRTTIINLELSAAWHYKYRRTGTSAKLVNRHCSEHVGEELPQVVRHHSYSSTLFELSLIHACCPSFCTLRSVHGGSKIY